MFFSWWKKSLVFLQIFVKAFKAVKEPLHQIQEMVQSQVVNCQIQKNILNDVTKLNTSFMVGTLQTCCSSRSLTAPVTVLYLRLTNKDYRNRLAARIGSKNCTAAALLIKALEKAGICGENDKRHGVRPSFGFPQVISGMSHVSFLSGGIKYHPLHRTLWTFFAGTLQITYVK